MHLCQAVGGRLRERLALLEMALEFCNHHLLSSYHRAPVGNACSQWHALILGHEHLAILSPGYIIHAETGLRVAGVDDGEVPPEPEHQEVLARIVLVILVGSGCRHLSEENFIELLSVEQC